VQSKRTNNYKISCMKNEIYKKPPQKKRSPERSEKKTPKIGKTLHNKSCGNREPFYNEFLKGGSHLGHKPFKISTQRGFDPLMTPYLLGEIYQVSIINSYKTRALLLKAFYIIFSTIKSGGHILIVNTNPEFYPFFYNRSSTPFLSYIGFKWINGILTNSQQISKSILNFQRFSLYFDRFLIKNNISFPRYKKLKEWVPGLLPNGKTKKLIPEQTIKKPDLIFLINPNQNNNVLTEARAGNIPVIALTDSNTDLSHITYPIPVNNNSLYFTFHCLFWISRIGEYPLFEINQNRGQKKIEYKKGVAKNSETVKAKR